MRSEQARYRTNLSAIRWLRVLSCGATIPIPIFVGFFVAHGVSLQDVFLLQAIFSIAVGVLEIPSGYIADVIGKSWTLRAAAMFNIAGISMFAIAGLSDSANGFWPFVLAEMLLAAAVSLISGADQALAEDSLRQLEGKRESFADYWALTMTFGAVADAGFFALGAFLAFYGPWLHIGAALACYVLAALMAMTLHEPPRVAAGASTFRAHLRQLSAIVVMGFNHPILRVVIVFSAATVAATRVGLWAIEPYLRPLLSNELHYSLIVGTLAVCVASSALIAPPLLRRAGFLHASNATLVVLLLSYAVLGTVSSPWCAIFLALTQAAAQFQICMASVEVSRHTMDFKATYNSLRPALDRVFTFVLLTSTAALAGDGPLSLTLMYTCILLAVGFVVLQVMLPKPHEISALQSQG